MTRTSRHAERGFFCWAGAQDMANDRHISPAADPIALTARLMVLLPRLALAMSQTGYRQLREVAGLDYSLIDYQGLFAAGGRFALGWWLEPLRALRAQTELVARSLSLIERQYRGGSELAASRSGADKRFLDRAWNEDPVLRAARELYLLYSDWLTAQLRDCPAPERTRQAEAGLLYAPAVERSCADQRAAHQSEG